MYCFLRGFEEKINLDKNTKIRFLVKFKNAFSQKYHNPILGKIVIEMATCILIWFDCLIDFIKYILFSQSSESWRSMHWNEMHCERALGTIHSKMKWLSSLTHPHVVPNPMLWFIFETHIKIILKNPERMSVLPGNKITMYYGLEQHEVE